MTTWTKWELAYVANTLALLARGDYGVIPEDYWRRWVIGDAELMAHRADERASDTSGLEWATIAWENAKARAPVSAPASNAAARVTWHQKQLAKARAESRRYWRLAEKIRAWGLPVTCDVTP